MSVERSFRPGSPAGRFYVRAVAAVPADDWPPSASRHRVSVVLRCRSPEAFPGVIFLRVLKPWASMMLASTNASTDLPTANSSGYATCG